jgi:hypothetical protein
LTKAQYQRQVDQEHRILISGFLAIGADSVGVILARPANPRIRRDVGMAGAATQHARRMAATRHIAAPAPDVPPVLKLKVVES